jgi:preprotein translocase subunit YajC
MPLLPHLSGFYGALQPAVIFAAAKTTTKSSGSGFFFILVILAIGAYFLLGPQRRRRKQQVDLHKQIAQGDEVVTTSGIIGRVADMSDDRVQLVIAPGTTVEVLRAAIARRLDAPIPPSDEVAEHEEHDNHEHPGDEADPGATP